MHRKTHRKTTLCPVCLRQPRPSDVTEGALPSAHLVEAEIAKARGAWHALHRQDDGWLLITPSPRRWASAFLQEGHGLEGQRHDPKFHSTK